jgi:1-aminocyclopropane-1-carboxylate deaminase
MRKDELIHLENSRVDAVTAFDEFNVRVGVLRLDLVHPFISGNKWFKLKNYLKDAAALGKKTILSFGGAHSNQIVATAAAAKDSGLNSIGIIRGERTPQLSNALQQALDFGMELFFISREQYRNKTIPGAVFDKRRPEDVYIINEGGYGIKGMEGAMDILKEAGSSWSHIVAAAGTGTTVAGLVESTGAAQEITGISVFKNNFSLLQETENLISENNRKRFTLLHDYHFGGYAKYNAALIHFMNEWYRSTGIPSDFVYTGKLFFAVNDLIQKKYFPSGSRILLVHSGGLQGNLSLPKGTLIF